MFQRHVLKQIVCLAALLYQSSALAQEDPLRDLGDPVARVQEQWRSVADDDRAELILLPVLAGMEEPPEEYPIPITPEHEGWDALDAWISAPAQQAAFEAVETVGVFDSRFIFSLGYGQAYAHAKLSSNPLVLTLTNSEFLAGMEFEYLEAMDNLFVAVGQEAIKRASQGDGKGALQLHASMLRTMRLVSDRPMYDEVDWSFHAMLGTLELMRDIAYLYPQSISPADIKSLIKELDDRELRIDRVRFPMGDKLAYQQLVRELFFKFGSPDPSRFGPVMAMLASGDSPLQLFGEAGWWVGAMAEHGDYYRTIDAVDLVFGDWEFRWGLDPHDLFHTNESDFDRLDAAANAMLLAQLDDEAVLLDVRRLVEVELAGTRLSLGSVGYRQELGDYPDPLFAIRPGFVREVDIDPFDPAQTISFHYFVPIRDQERTARQAPTPHEVQVASTGVLGDQREQVFGANVMPNLDSFLSSISQEQMSVLVQDISNLFASPGTRDGSEPIVISKASLLYKLLVISLAASFQSSAGSFELLSENPLIEATILSLQSGDTLASLGEKSRSRRNLELDDIKRLFEACHAFYLQEQKIIALEQSTSSRFTASLGRDTFVLYSIGPDEKDDFARSVGYNGTDYLLWPPIVSLVREHGGMTPLE